MKLLIVDDHPLLRSGLTAVLAQAVIRQAADAQQGLKATPQNMSFYTHKGCIILFL